MDRHRISLLIYVGLAVVRCQPQRSVPPAPAGVPSDYVQVSRQPDAVNPGASNVPSFNCADLADGFYSLGPCSRYFASCAGNTTNYMECPQGLVLVKSTETQCDYAPSDCEESTPDLTSQTQTSETVSETTQYGSNATSFYGANSSVTPTVPNANSGENNYSSTIQSQAYTLTSEHPTSSTTDDLTTSTTDEPASSTTDEPASSTTDELASSTTEYPTSSTTEEPLPSGVQALIQDYFRQRILNPTARQKRESFDGELSINGTMMTNTGKYERPSCENLPAGVFFLSDGCAQHYVRCNHVGLPTIHFCPGEKRFSERDQSCDHAWNVPECVPKRVEDKTQGSTICDGPHAVPECANLTSTITTIDVVQENTTESITTEVSTPAGIDLFNMTENQSQIVTYCNGAEEQDECVNITSTMSPTNISDDAVNEGKQSRRMSVNLCVNVTDGNLISEGCSSRYFACYSQISYPAACPGELKFRQETHRCEEESAVEECNQTPYMSKFPEQNPIQGTTFLKFAFRRTNNTQISSSSIPSTDSSTSAITATPRSTRTFAPTTSSSSRSTAPGSSSISVHSTNSPASSNTHSVPYQSSETGVSEPSPSQEATSYSHSTSRVSESSTNTPIPITSLIPVDQSTIEDAKSTTETDNLPKVPNSCLNAKSGTGIVLGCNQEYWYCVNRIAFKRHCPYGYRFNQLAQKCDEEDKVPQCAKQ